MSGAQEEKLSAEGEGNHGSCPKTETDLDVALLVQHQVLQLQIAVDDSVGMQIGQCQQNLGGIQAAAVLAKALLLAQMEKQLEEKKPGQEKRIR